MRADPTPVEGIVNVLSAQRTGDHWIAKCPAHDDKTPSLSISEGQDGRALLKCHAGCATEAIVAALGLQVKDLFAGNGQTPVPIKINRAVPAGFNWDRCVAVLTPADLARIGNERWYSQAFMNQLHEEKLIGSYGGQVAFPVCDNARVIGCHYRVDGGWRYYPTGTKAKALVVGKLIAGDPVHVFESQWDAFAFMDVSGMRDGIIITRGAGNGALVGDLIPARSTVYVWTQNDETDAKGKNAGEDWQVAVCSGTTAAVKRVSIPVPHKDLNDWTKAGATSGDLLQMVVAAELVQEALVRTLDQFVVDPETDGGNLLGRRWVCREGGLVIAAPTGIGKTTFEMQGAIMWALGRDHFGIKPSGRLRILIIQAENDDGDMAEIRDGIFSGLNLPEKERAEACAAIQVVCESAVTGNNFIALVRRLVARHRPDLITIDPFFAYLGDSVSEQKAVSTFLRNGLNPILQQYGCGVILVHHTNKPKTGREKPDWAAGDYAYLGAGTAEIANWARAVMVIRSIGSYTVFSVELGKRGRRAGLVNDDGKAIYSFYIKHARGGGICWEAATDDDFVSAGKAIKAKTTDDVLRLLPMEGDISQARLLEAASLAGIGKNLARELIDELIKEQPQRAFLWLTKRPGTRPAKSYSRQPQELFNR